MLLVVDVGNTNMTMGVFDGTNLLTTFRMTTTTLRTSDEYGNDITSILEKKGIEVYSIEDVIISSVVPKIMHSLINSFIKYFNKKPIVVGPGIKTGIKLNVPNPHEVGADRIVDVAGAYEIYGDGKPVIVIDFGTATTYDLVSADGSFDAAVTAPGIRTSAKALWENAAKLPEIEIKRPATILAKDTITSMQAGLVYGCIGQTEYIIDCMKMEAGLDDVKVVATGGLGRIIAQETTKIDVYDADLTLKGMMLIYNKCKNR
ncbi:MAG: type III pantothenate kinase [Eubacterium sp.]